MFAFFAPPTDCVEAFVHVGVSEMAMKKKGVRIRRACDLHNAESTGRRAFAARCIVLRGNTLVVIRTKRAE